MIFFLFQNFSQEFSGLQERSWWRGVGVKTLGFPLFKNSCWALVWEALIPWWSMPGGDGRLLTKQSRGDLMGCQVSNIWKDNFAYDRERVDVSLELEPVEMPSDLAGAWILSCICWAAQVCLIQMLISSPCVGAGGDSNSAWSSFILLNLFFHGLKWWCFLLSNFISLETARMFDFCTVESNDLSLCWHKIKSSKWNK